MYPASVIDIYVPNKVFSSYTTSGTTRRGQRVLVRCSNSLSLQIMELWNCMPRQNLLDDLLSSAVHAIRVSFAVVLVRLLILFCRTSLVGLTNVERCRHWRTLLLRRWHPRRRAGGQVHRTWLAKYSSNSNVMRSACVVCKCHQQADAYILERFPGR
jgi:hypothetical protein